MTPFGTAYYNGVLLRLRLGPDGIGRGGNVDDAMFMWARGHRPGPTPGRVRRPVRASTTTVDPRTVTYGLAGDATDVGLDAGWAIGLSADDCRVSIDFTGTDESGPCTVSFDAGDGSWAAVAYRPGRGVYDVVQHGTRSLWDEIHAAYERWLSAGHPSRFRYGVTAEPTGRQTVWLDRPDQVITPDGPLDAEPRGDHPQ